MNYFGFAFRNTALTLILCTSLFSNVFAQCNNADFSSGDFTSWTGTYAGTTAGFDQAANDAAPTINNSHCLITTAAFDATVGGSLLPMLPPGGGKSMRLGNAVGNSAKESVSYAFTVNANNTNFTYQYAVVLDGSSTHGAVQQPYFKISMTDANGAAITCATYDVNSTSSGSIGGFDSVVTAGTVVFGIPTGGGKVKYKTWSSVTIPLQNYVGQTVKVTFETRDCEPTGAPGGHWAYAYISANCSPLEILTSAPSVCPGQTVTLTAPAAKAYSWKGPSPGSIVSGATSSVATVNAEGTYTVTLTAFGSAGCTYDLTADMLPFLPGSGVLVNSATICTGQSATLTASGGAPYTWSTGATTTSITVTPGSTTTYSVSGGTCPSTNSGTVTVNTTPTSTFTGTTVCANVGSTITYTGTGDANSTYTWGFDGGTATPGTGQGPLSVSWASSGTKNVTLTVANGPCPSTLTTVPVTVNATPTVTVPPATICNGSSGILTAAGASTYLWSEGTAVAALTDSPTATTSYTVTGTSSGCSATAVGTITVNQLEDAGFSYTPATVCKTGGSNPTPVITGVTGGTFSCPNNSLVIDPTTGIVDLAGSALGAYTITYTTSGSCPNSSTFDISLVNIPIADFTLGTYCQNVTNPLPTYINNGSAGVFSSTAGLTFASTSTGEINLASSTAGDYTVTNTIAAGGGCPAATATSTITINAVPFTTVNSPTACSGDPAIITAAGATNYTWSDNSTSNTLSVTPGVTTTYTVVGESNNCTSTAIATVTVNVKPVVTVESATICAGESVTVYASGASTYAWSDGSVLDSLVFTAPGVSVPYTVTGTTSGCAGSASGNITVNALPVITVNSPAICQGLSGNLTGSGGNTYIWIAPGNLFFIGNPYSITPTASATYTVIGSTATCGSLPVNTPAEQDVFRACLDGGCSSTVVSNVTLIQLPVISVNAPTICAGQSATINASGAASYTWSTGASGASITESPTATTSYTVTDNTVGCSGSAVATITVNNLPVVTVNARTICTGSSASLTASGASTYSWSNGSATNPLTISPTATTSYTVTGTSTAGCTAIANTSVTVNSLPTISSTSSTICEGLTASLTASGTAVSYVWSNGSVTNPVSVSPSSTTSYTVTGTDANNCISTATGTVTVFPQPDIQFSASPQPAGVLSPAITFTDQSSADVTFWEWDFGDAADTLGSNEPNPVHNYPSVETTYTVTLNVLNDGLCANSMTKEIVIGPEYSFYIPNSFSPNEDGKNDVFLGKGNGIIEFELRIFDRWGNAVFKTDDINKGWDGKANGSSELTLLDVYVWKVAITDIFKKKHDLIGTVTIVRGE